MSDTSPAPTVSPSPLTRVAARFDLSDRRNLVGFIVLGFCAGVMVGAKVMAKGIPPVMPGNGNGGLGGNPATPSVVFRDVPCAGCRERELRAQAAREGHTEPAPPGSGGVPTEADNDDEARARAQAAQMDVQPAPKRFSATAEVDQLPEDIARDAAGRPL